VRYDALRFSLISAPKSVKIVFLLRLPGRN